MAGKGGRLAVVLLAVAAVAVLVWQGYATSASQQGARLQVASVSAELPPVGSDGAGITGRLGASRSGNRACFWISDGHQDAEKRYLLFARQYSASRALHLLDEQGRTIARAGDMVSASIAAPRPGTAPEFCPSGTGMTVFDVSRSLS